MRTPTFGYMIGFCIIYITYVDSKSERLIGSLAIILVGLSYHTRGVRLSLHNYARQPAVSLYLRLGTTFPRLLYGLPLNSPAEDWFRRRGWRMDETLPGTGQVATD